MSYSTLGIQFPSTPWLLSVVTQHHQHFPHLLLASETGLYCQGPISPDTSDSKRGKPNQIRFIAQDKILCCIQILKKKTTSTATDILFHEIGARKRGRNSVHEDLLLPAQNEGKGKISQVLTASAARPQTSIKKIRYGSATCTDFGQHSWSFFIFANIC